MRNGIPRTRVVTLLQRRRLISRDLDLMQMHGKKTRTSNTADPEKTGLCDEGEGDLAVRRAGVPLKTDKSA